MKCAAGNYLPVGAFDGMKAPLFYVNVKELVFKQCATNLETTIANILFLKLLILLPKGAISGMEKFQTLLLQVLRKEITTTVRS